MKRPLCAVGFTMLASLLILCEVDNVFLAVGICGLFSSAAIIFIIKYKKKQSTWLPTVLICVAASCLIFLANEALIYYPAIKLTGQSVQLTASLSDYPSYDGEKYYFQANVKLPSAIFKTKVRVYLKTSSSLLDEDGNETTTSNLKPGDTLTFNAVVYKAGGSVKIIEQNMKSNKIFLYAYPVGKVTVASSNGKSLSFLLAHERLKVINQLRSAYDNDTSAIGISVLLGDKTYLSDKIYSDFKAAGVSHVMAVSGMHLSIWVMFLMNICVYFGLNKRKTALFLTAFVLLVMNFACFSGSVVRAGIMMLVYLSGFILKKESDALNSLGFASIIILLNNPFAAMNVSFLLSFTATLSIIVAAAPLCKIITDKLSLKITNPPILKIISAVISSVIVSLCVSVLTLPICAAFFGEVSIMSVITNLIFLPVVTPMIVLFGLYVMFYFVPVLSGVIQMLAKWLSVFCKNTAAFIASFEHSVYVFGKPSVVVAVYIFAAMLLLFAWIIKKKNKNKRSNYF